MKKFLLPVALVATACAPAFAFVETGAYETVDGIECKNLYNISRAYSPAEYAASPFAEFTNKIRSTAAYGGKLYLAHSRTMVVGEDSNDYAHLIVYDQESGKFIGQVQLTVGGQPLAGLLCANQIGFDDFGNLWLIGLTGSTEKTPWSLYHVKDLTTGETELIAQLKVPDSEAEAFGRHDYYDLAGDVTGKQAGTVVLSAVASGTDTYVVGFERQQGSDEWGPHMYGGEYYATQMTDTYPAGATTWDGAPMVRIIRDEEYSGELYYVDPFVGYPTLYNTEGAMIDSFAACPELVPNANANGCMEFSLAGHDYLAYTYSDYDKGVGSQVRVARMGEGMSFDGMTPAWDLPSAGLGSISDSGTRMFGISPWAVTDENGKQGCLLSLFKCNGGLATYLLSEPGFQSGVNDIVADNASDGSVVLYNLNGQQVTGDNPAAGLYLRRQGNTVTKVLVK